MKMYTLREWNCMQKIEHEQFTDGHINKSLITLCRGEMTMRHGESRNLCHYLSFLLGRQSSISFLTSARLGDLPAHKFEGTYSRNCRFRRRNCHQRNLYGFLFY